MKKILAVLMIVVACFVGCAAAGPKPPIELPFAVHKAGATVSTELRIPEKGPFVYQFALKFMHNDGDRADRMRDRERVRKLLGSGGKNKWTGKLVDPGIPISIKITLSEIDSLGEHIFLEKEFSTAGIDANGSNYFKREIGLRELKRSPGLYRVTVKNLKGVPELEGTRVLFIIDYPRQG